MRTKQVSLEYCVILCLLVYLGEKGCAYLPIHQRYVTWPQQWLGLHVACPECMNSGSQELQSPARALIAWQCTPAFPHQIEESRVKGITQEDTPSQLLCLLLRYLRRGATRQQIASVTLGIRIGNLDRKSTRLNSSHTVIS